MTKTVMIVDDEPDIVTTTAKLLKGEGYAVVTAASGKECLKKLRTGTAKPNLIILDFFMPNMSGREVLEAIRGDKKLSGIPVIFMTVAEFREIGIAKFKGLGVSAYVLKPVNVDHLMSTIKKTLTG
jgi:CheY-like chemotaxis protein